MNLQNETKLAEYLGVSINTLRKWRWEGKGPKFIKLGSRVAYRVSDVEAFLEAQARLSTSDTGVMSCL